ncbi:hypothetical protein FXO38_03842 [Capsicum annuum]|nr:hypothetical protein FXO38_03842 [Capsicum annuum]
MTDTAPSVAVFHLKRFQNDDFVFWKVDKHVSFSLELNLLPYTDNNQTNYVCILEAINSSYFHELKKIVDNELKKIVQISSTPGPPSAINSSLEKNASQDIGVTERMEPLLPKLPSRSQSTLRKLIINFYLLVSDVISSLLLANILYVMCTCLKSITPQQPVLFITSADQFSNENQLQMNPEQETEIMLACSMIKKRVPGSRDEELMTALHRLGSRGSSMSRKDDGSSIDRRSSRFWLCSFGS